MRARKEVQDELVCVISACFGGTAAEINKIIDLWFELQDAPADNDKVNVNCYKCGNVIKIDRKERDANQRRGAVMYVCENCHETESGKSV